MIVVIGAGISGLSAAWFLHRKGLPVQVLERADRVGGVIASEHLDGYLIEHGPNSTLQKPESEDDALGRLVGDVGLSDSLMAAGTAAKKRFVMRGGQLRALPTSPPAMIATRLFSLAAKLRLLGEPFIGRGKGEETIAQFVTRRLGPEFLDYAIEPFVSGVYAGDPRTLSVRAAVPKIYALERDHGSLIRGAIALGKAAKAAAGPPGRLVSFDDGMEVLPRTIAERLPAGSVRTGCRMVGLEPAEDGWRVAWGTPTESGVIEARHVILAVPAAAAADLITSLSPEAAGELRDIAYAPIVSAGMGYDPKRVGHALDGFGFLVPRREGVRILGGLFSSTLFPGRAPAGRVLITTFIGGAMDGDAVALDDSAVTRCLSDDLARSLGAAGEPAMVHLTRWERAIPQYVLGHLERIARIDGLLEDHPGLHFRANWRDGISVADCVRNGEKLADHIA